jgi:hypothetical protein
MVCGAPVLSDPHSHLLPSAFPHLPLNFLPSCSLQATITPTCLCLPSTRTKRFDPRVPRPPSALFSPLCSLPAALLSPPLLCSPYLASFAISSLVSLLLPSWLFLLFSIQPTSSFSVILATILSVPPSCPPSCPFTPNSALIDTTSTHIHTNFRPHHRALTNDEFSPCFFFQMYLLINASFCSPPSRSLA